MVENQVDWRQRHRDTQDKQDKPIEPESTGEKQSLADQLGIKVTPAPEPVVEQAGTGDDVKVGVQRPTTPAEPQPEPVENNPPDEPVAPEDTAEEPTVDPLTGTPIA